MRKVWLPFAALCSLIMVFAVQTLAAGSDQQYLGAWSGTWEGGGASGRFDVTFERGSDGKLSGGVSVGEDTGDYTARFSTAAFEGNQLKARYDYPKADQSEIVLSATFDGKSAKGSWQLVAKGQDAAFANGTWTVTQK